MRNAVPFIFPVFVLMFGVMLKITQTSLGLTFQALTFTAIVFSVIEIWRRIQATDENTIEPRNIIFAATKLFGPPCKLKLCTDPVHALPRGLEPGSLVCLLLRIRLLVNQSIT